MSDVIYVLLTLGFFILLSLLVGVLDRHSGASETGGGHQPAQLDQSAFHGAPAADRGGV